MKKIFCVTIILFLMLCNNGLPQSNSYNVNLRPNQDLGTGLDPDKGYEVWMAARSDTSAVVFPTNFVRIKFFRHDSLVALYGGNPTSTLQLIDIFPSPEDGGWLKAAAFAYDYSGNRSILPGFSPWFHKNDLTPPGSPTYAAPAISR